MVMDMIGDTINGDDRYSRVGRLFIPYDRAESVLNALDRIMRYGYGNQKDGVSSKLLLVLGPSRSGKTLALKKFASKFPHAEEKTGFIRLVVYVSIPEKTTIKALLTSLLEAYGDPRAEFGTAINKVTRVRHYIKEQRTQLLILDEGHHLFDPDKERLTYSVSESIKSLLNLGLCPIVLAGMPHTAEVVNRNDQLKGRLLETIKLNGLRWNDEAEQTLFRKILHKFERESDFPERSGLGEKDLAYAIWRATNGLIGLVSQLLMRAIIEAENCGSKKISRENLSEAYNNLHAADDSLNPFAHQVSSEPVTPHGNKGSNRMTKLHRGIRTKLRLPV
jgi:type II secretory pathway predicted ATPase ExeA